jgi:hypothetical protein
LQEKKMDFDVNNQAILSAGAQYQSRMQNRAVRAADGWQPMTTAPRDGTVIEVINTYGVAPTYSLAKWTKERSAIGQNGDRMLFTTEQPEWVDAVKGGGWISESSLQWRPYNGTVTSYVDPTGGAQDSPAYWRGAVAAKYGLPLDYFEKETARNVAKNSDAPKGFWAWLFGW